VDQSPLTVDAMGQQRGVFVFRRHDHAIAFKVAEILRERERNTRAVARVRGVDDGVFF